MTSSDPLLQPFRLIHLTLKNRVMSTSHEPADSEDGLPKERYRLYHLEKAGGGMALIMTAGSAVVSRDSPSAFGNLHAYRDEIGPSLKELADACHEHDCKVMIQITHLGRRTGWNKADWLPVLWVQTKYLIPGLASPAMAALDPMLCPAAFQLRAVGNHEKRARRPLTNSPD